MANVPDELSAKVPVSSLATPLVLNALIGIATLLAFWAGAAGAPWCYTPRRCRPTENGRRRPPPKISLMNAGWSKAMFSLTESELISICGLDAVMFIRFHLLGLKFFVPVAIISTCVLLPLHASSSSGSDHVTFADLSMANLPDGSAYFWLHFVFVVVFTFYLFFLLKLEVFAYLRLRHQYHLVPDPRHGPRPDQLTICVGRVPDYLRNQVNFDRYFRSIFDDQLAAAVVIRDRRVVLALQKQQQSARHQLELAVTDHRRRRRRRHWFGPKLDAIECSSADIHRLQDEIDERLRGPSKTTSVGFVTFTSFKMACLASTVPLTMNPMGMIAHPAVEPRDVYWPNLDLSTVEVRCRFVIIHIVLFTLIAFWTVPVFIINSLTSPDTLKSMIPILTPILEASPFLEGLFNQFLPSIGLLVFQLVLPPILLWMSKLEGSSSKSSIHMGLFTKFFLFQFFNFFLASVVAGSLTTTLSKIVHRPMDTPILLGDALPLQAATFISYVMLQALSRVPLQLLRLGAFIIGSLKLRLFAHTPEDVLRATSPGPFMYAREWPMHIFVFMLGLAYAEITPLILPCVAFFFLVSSFVFRYLLVFVHETKFESGGGLFPLMLSRLIAGVLIGLLTLVGMFVLKKAVYQSSLLGVLIGVTLLFHLYCKTLIKTWGRLSIEEAVELDRGPKFDVEQLRHEAESFYRQPCALQRTMDVDDIKQRMSDAIVHLNRVPDMNAIQSLVELAQQPTTTQRSPIASSALSSVSVVRC